MRYLIALAALFALSPVAVAVALERPAPLRATPVPLARDDPARTRAGGLAWLGGWQLASGDRRFGGISSLLAERGRFIAIGDAGNIMRFRLTPGGGIVDEGTSALTAGPGTGQRKSERDTESATRDPISGQIWIGFESANQLWRYSPDLIRAEAHAAPAAMTGWPSNGGPEALVRLRDGRFLVLAEEARRADGSTEALLFPGDPTAPGARPLRFGYRAPRGYAATDAAELPDGRLLVLHRRFTLMDGLSAKLAVVDLAGAKEGAALVGREIATLAPPLTVDNMEALAVEEEGDRTIVWIASDDNFSAMQRTLLLKFALVE